VNEPNQLRRNPLTRRWTIFSESELTPEALVERTRQVAARHQPAEHDGPCPFCPGNEAMTPPEICVWRDGAIRYSRDHGPAGSNWTARVFPNRFPVFGLEGELGRRAARNNYDVLNAIGANEIIVETRDHQRSWAETGPEIIGRSLLLYRERMRDLQRNPHLGHQAVYKHVGMRRASRIVHPYSQLIAAPVVPERVRRELDAFRQHYTQKERCLLCDVTREVQRSSKDLQVVENAGFTAFVPFFAAHPFEVWVIPRRHEAFFPSVRDDEVELAADVLTRVLGKLEKVLGSLAMTLSLLTAPNPHYAVQLGYWRTLGEDYHWRIVIIPRLPLMADLYRGFTLGTGFDVNPIFPEQAAAFLRAAGA
jgi:UDPglucose--hexose-1-phosphate uridylyltransferase